MTLISNMTLIFGGINVVFPKFPVKTTSVSDEDLFFFGLRQWRNQGWAEWASVVLS